MRETDVHGLLRDGFPGQRMFVLPRPLVRSALEIPGLQELLVTDSGYFPHAEHHGRSRPAPIDQAILMICVKGAGWCETGAGRFNVHAGQVVLIPPHTPHAYGADADDPWTLWWLHLAGRSVSAMVGLIGASASAPVRMPTDPYAAALLAAEVVSRMEQDTTEQSLVAAAGAAWHLLPVLGTSRTSTAGADELAERAAEYLRENLTVRTTVAELASTVGLSTSHFAAVFRRRMGMPVNQYQMSVRMIRARELLDLTQMPVATIAAAVGYDDPFYFARQFRRLHGVSPRGYRQQQKG